MEEKKWGVLDCLQLIWFDFWIKSAVRKKEREMYSGIKMRPKVAKKLKELGYEVYIYSSGATAINW